VQIQNQTSDAKAIEAAKGTNVLRIESSLPDKLFEQWLRGLVGMQAQIVWEVNDCGEQTGNPAVDSGRNFPMCVAALVNLAGERKLNVLLNVGTFKGGVKAGPASFFASDLIEPNGSHISPKSLSQLAEAIDQLDRVSDYIEAHRENGSGPGFILAEEMADINSDGHSDLVILYTYQMGPNMDHSQTEFLVVFFGDEIHSKPMWPILVGWRGGMSFDEMLIRGSQIVLKGRFSMSGDGMSDRSGVGEVTFQYQDGKLIEIEGWWKRKK
jgi:hypothetical protein